jgi:NADH dehydrogenase
VRQLAAQGAKVRVAVRHPQDAAFQRPPGEGLITPLYSDVRDEISVSQAVESVQAVVNAVGLYVERGHDTFDAVHAQGALNVARQASRAGVARLLHVSGIGADPNSESRYVRARAQGESLVREAFEGATILRPSVLFGREDAFLNTLTRLVRFSPVLPLFGNGATLLQPVFVGNVAEAVVNVLAEPTSRGKVYEIGGPRVYSYKALIELLVKHLGRKRFLAPVPYFLWELQAALLSVLPNPPLTYDQIVLMKRDNVVSKGALTLGDLGIDPTAVETLLPAYRF